MDLESYAEGAGGGGGGDDVGVFGTMSINKDVKPLSRSTSELPATTRAKGKEEDDEDDYLSNSSPLSRSQEISSSAFEQQRTSRLSGRPIPVATTAFDINMTSLNAEFAGSDGYLAGTPSDNMMKEDITTKRFGNERFGDSVEKREQTEAVKDKVFNEEVNSLLNILEKRSDIDYSHIQFGRRLGAGAFGEVFHAQLWGIDVAVKKIKCERYNFPLQEVTSELAMLRALRHPNCVLFLGFVKSPCFCIITEFMPRGSLYDIIHNPQVRLNNQHIWKVAYSVGLAMSYLHSQKPAIVHKDLKSHNILVDYNWTIKVADYGLSSVMDSIKSHQFWAGTAQWRAPEVTETTYGLAADVYSYGVLLWEMITRKKPFEGLSPAQALKVVKEKNARPPIPPHCPHFFRELMESCWHVDPTERPNFPKIVEDLKAYEKDSSHYSSSDPSEPSIEVFRESSIPAAQAFFRAKQNALSTLLPEGVMYARCWTAMFHFRMRPTGLNMLNKDIIPMLRNIATGCFVFLDDFGRAMSLFIYDSPERVREADELALSLGHVAVEMNNICCTPLIRETLELTTFDINIDPKHSKDIVALIITITMTPNNVKEAQNSYETYVIPELRQMEFWRGSLILTDLNRAKFKLINLFSNKFRLSQLEEEGFVHQQLANFSNFIGSTPVIEHYSLESNCFFNGSVLSEPSPATVLPPSEPELDKEWEIVLNIAKEHEAMETPGRPVSPPLASPPPLSASTSAVSSTSHHDASSSSSSSSNSHQPHSPNAVPDAGGDPIWKQLRRWGAFINGRTLNENELSVFQSKFGIPSSEWVIQVFICVHHKHGPGQLYITPNYVCYSSILSFDRNKIVIPIRDILSLNKTKYSLLPGSGHAIEIMTVDRKLTIFRGIIKRDLVVSTIVEQGNTMRPRHLMLVLFQGEPEELNKSCMPSKQRDSIQLQDSGHGHHFTNIRGSTNSTYVKSSTETSPKNTTTTTNTKNKSSAKQTNSSNNNNNNNEKSSSSHASGSSSEARKKGASLSGYITNPQACAIKGFSSIQRSSRSSSSPIMPQFLRPPQPQPKSSTSTSTLSSSSKKK
eukprot:TRINITY_DN324_c0_g3_i1.p1 TRINITY_DN324_c0_g3~~TRINITY_DN324_c0_g3_i1.p1  ORF type:complete len:1230 (-),score=275.04 TRINITY_DN324_c0_g3_i1:2625-5846(-)